MGGSSAQNASIHSASTKRGPAHPRDVDDVDGRRPHLVDQRYTSAPHDQHEGARPEYAQHGHAQQTGARARTRRRQTARAHRAHSGSTGVRTAQRQAHHRGVGRPTPVPAPTGPPPWAATARAPHRGAGPREMRLAPGHSSNQSTCICSLLTCRVLLTCLSCRTVVCLATCYCTCLS